MIPALFRRLGKLIRNGPSVLQAPPASLARISRPLFRRQLRLALYGALWGLSGAAACAATPACWFAGSEFLGTGETGVWEFLTADADADLLRWRVSLQTPAQWTPITGAAKASSFTYTFNTAGEYLFFLEVQDVAGNTGTRAFWVLVSDDHKPTASITGSTALAVGQVGSWNFSSTDPEANLSQWRVSLNTNTPNSVNPTLWTSISGASQSSSFNYTFNSPRSYAFILESKDSTNLSRIQPIPVVVAGSWSTPNFEPAYWNSDPRVQEYNNCYNYANNVHTNTRAQPGRASGYDAVTTSEKFYSAKVREGAMCDGLEPTTASSVTPDGRTKIALAIWPGRDYHWYRRDANGMWTHKLGSDPASNLDSSGNPITNPETADRGLYLIFGGYFFTPSDAAQGWGKAYIK